MSNDYTRDKVVDSIEDQTKRRRSGRWRRKRYVLLIAFAVLLGIVLCLPSFISHSPIGRSIVSSTLSGYELDGNVDSIRIGWVTPLRVNGLKINGKHAGSKISVEQIDGPTTILGVLTGGTSDLGEITVRGVNVQCEMSEGLCSLEKDLAALLVPSESDSASTTGKFHIQDLAVAVKDSVSGSTWIVSQANAEVDLTAASTAVKFAGVLAGPNDDSGSIQGSAQLENEADKIAWKLNLETESLPLSLLTLVRRRLPEATAAMPPQFSGDASGAIRLTGATNGNIHSSVDEFEIRNLYAVDPNNPKRVWRNSRATLNGDLTLEETRVVGKELTATTDFAAATLNGAFSSSLTLVGADDNPLKWLDALDGNAQAHIDLAAFQKALPGILPIKNEAEILSGRATATVQTAASDIPKSKLTFKSDTIRCRAHGRAVVIEPVSFEAMVANIDGHINAENFKLTSSFASAVGKGTMRTGEATVAVDFGRLSSMLRPLIDLSDVRVAGTVQGKIGWDASADNVWRLNGNGKASNLQLLLPGGKEIRRSSLDGTIAAVGRWSGETLEELSGTNLSVKTNGLSFQADLTHTVPNPTLTEQLPFRITGNGRLETLTEIAGPWLPSDLQRTQGAFDVVAWANLSTVSGRITKANLNLTEPRIAYQGTLVAQRSVRCDFDGSYDWPSGDLHSQTSNLTTDAVQLKVVGDLNAEVTDLTVNWSADLQQLQSSVQTKSVQNPQPLAVGANRAPQASSPYQFMGACSGQAKITADDNYWIIESDTKTNQLTITEPKPVAANFSPLPSRFGPLASAAPIWYEPSVQVKGATKIHRTNGEILAENLQVSTNWLAATLSGPVKTSAAGMTAQLSGQAQIMMPDVAKKLTDLCGSKIDLQGTHQTPITINYSQPTSGEIAYQVATKIGWDRGAFGGVDFGPANIPLQIDQTTVLIQPAMIPVGQGQLNIAGQVFYNSGPMRIQLNPGLIAQDIRMTPEMTDAWLKYLAPLAADATQLDGSMSVEVDEAIVMFDNPLESRVRGRLGILGAEMRTGRLANQIINGMDQLKALAKMRANAFGAQQDQPAESKTLITMPAQTVEFTFSRGIAQHQRLYFDIDRAQVITSGTVNVNGPLNLTAQVPLDAKWLGNDLKGLSGQPVVLPVAGTLTQPRLDSRGIREIITKLGTQAVQQKADNFFEQQMNKGIDKIFGR